jgi:hypothetical protein
MPDTKAVAEHYTHGGFEPPRVYRRLQLLRGLEYEQSESIFPGG